MLQKLLAPIRGCVAGLILALNTVILFTAMIPGALIKLVFRGEGARRLCDPMLNRLAETWVGINKSWMSAVGNGDGTLRGVEGLQPRGWYIVASNHQTWVDILILQRAFYRRIPFLKFFLKHELIYVPVIGLAWWALDFPFMRRRGGKSAQGDMARARKACERFAVVPTSIISFLEGTRFTPEKHKQQRSPYPHLLKPKVGALGAALSTLGERFNSMLDVTIVYPDGVPKFWDLLSGKLKNVIIEVHEIEIPHALCAAEFERDAKQRAALQDWIGTLWQAKNERISALLAEHKSR